MDNESSTEVRQSVSEVHHNQPRKSVAASKKLAWGVGGLTLVGALNILSPFYERFYSREEGIATEKNVERIERVLEAKTLQLRVDLKADQLENTRILERKIDTLILSVEKGSEKTAREFEKHDDRIDALELLVQITKPKGR